MSTPTNIGWAAFRKELWRRTREPADHVVFVGHFLLSVVVIGGLGLWVELGNYFFGPPGQDLGNVRTAIATFFPALAGSTAMQLSLGKHIKQLQILGYFFMILFGGVGILLIAHRDLDPAWALGIGTAFYLGSLWFWWIANADNPEYLDDEVPPTAATGGDDTTGPLPGDLEGFDA